MAWHDEFRAQMCLEAGVANLNAGTLSPTSRPVMDRANELRERQASNPHGFYFMEQPSLIAAARESLASFLKVAASELFLLPNVTWAINLAINASVSRRGGRRRIVMPDLEYGSLINAWQSAAAAHGMTAMILPISACRSADEIVDVFRNAMGDDVAVLYASHVASANGLVLPVRELGRLARDCGAYSIVDGAHAVGLIDPLDLPALGVDAYGGNLHKWMMGPATSGFLWCGSAALRAAIKPLVVSWGSIAMKRGDGDASVAWFGGSRLQGSVEFNGSTDRVAQCVIPETIEFQQRVGFARMARRMAQLQRYAIERLSRLLKHRALPAGCATPGLSVFEFPAVDRAQFRDWMLSQHGVGAAVTRVREDVEGLPGRDLPLQERPFFLRVSTAWWNTEPELDRLEAAVQDFFKRKPYGVFLNG